MAVSRPPTHRRGITERPHNNNAVNQCFVHFTYNSLYSVGFLGGCYYHKEGAKKAYRTREVVCLPGMLRQTTNKKREADRPLSFFHWITCVISTLIQQTKCPQWNGYPVAVFDVVFYDIAVRDILYLLRSFLFPSYLKRMVPDDEVGHLG